MGYLTRNHFDYWFARADVNNQNVARFCNCCQPMGIFFAETRTRHSMLQHDFFLRRARIFRIPNANRAVLTAVAVSDSDQILKNNCVLAGTNNQDMERNHLIF